ncbi:helicase associated domain-containing protein [Streptomyces sp. NPDC058953]|uniref:helicase associated domain-containing protein n=1 Tax=unclassified Streptomyces TaxID=2593676 RepID=UPI0036C50009
MTAIDPDRACPWPPGRQRHCAVLRGPAAEEPGGVLPFIEPGVLFEGDDLGAWVARQQKPAVWKQLTGEQRERLTGLGTAPVEPPAPVPAGTGTEAGVEKLSAPFQRGVAAFAHPGCVRGTRRRGRTRRRGPGEEDHLRRGPAASIITPVTPVNGAGRGPVAGRGRAD